MHSMSYNYYFYLFICRCDFEATNFCQWRNLDDDEFDWSLQKGATFSADTGPMVDHTMYTAQGTYMFIETSAPRKQGLSSLDY